MLPEGRFLEFLFAAIVGLLVIGPKDLPIFMRKAGQFVRKIRLMATDFRHSFDELARQTELDELRKEVEALRNLNPLNDIKNEVRGAWDTGQDFYNSKPLTAEDAKSQEDDHAEHAQAARLKAAEIEPLIEAPKSEIVNSPKKPRKPRAKKLTTPEIAGE